ncbi:MAG: hypothetical protein EOO38_09040 [Cytophagaceae bacterium]|nr:MAG: hypothetical protein EOO38_09040 [Cytophagaceae bacterium]
MYSDRSDDPYLQRHYNQPWTYAVPKSLNEVLKASSLTRLMKRSIKSTYNILGELYFDMESETGELDIRLVRAHLHEHMSRPTAQRHLEILEHDLQLAGMSQGKMFLHLFLTTNDMARKRHNKEVRRLAHNASMAKCRANKVANDFTSSAPQDAEITEVSKNVIAPFSPTGGPSPDARHEPDDQGNCFPEENLFSFQKTLPPKSEVATKPEATTEMEPNEDLAHLLKATPKPDAQPVDEDDPAAIRALLRQRFSGHTDPVPESPPELPDEPEKPAYDPKQATRTIKKSLKLTEALFKMLQQDHPVLMDMRWSKFEQTQPELFSTKQAIYLVERATDGIVNPCGAILRAETRLRGMGTDEPWRLSWSTDPETNTRTYAETSGP